MDHIHVSNLEYLDVYNNGLAQMLTELGIKNLRSFSNECSFKLKPMTIFVGKNSSGKSTMLRVLPLLRQSIEGNSRGPVLWFGKYVDFGDYSEAISNNIKIEDGCNGDEGIEFLYNVNIPTAIGNDYYYIIRERRSTNEENNTSARINIKLGTQNQLTFTQKITIQIEGVIISYDISPRKNTAIITLSKDMGTISEKEVTIGESSKFLPSITGINRPQSKIKINESKSNYINDAHFELRMRNLWDYKNTIISECVDALFRFFNPNSSKQKIIKKLHEIRKIKRGDIEKQLPILFSDQRLFSRNLSSIKDRNIIINTIHAFLLLSNLPEISRFINSSLEIEFNNIRYIGPIRATAERYYRFQDLQVDEMDHTGSNLAMIINSFTAKQKKEFEDWTRVSFGFTVFIRKNGGHYAIKIAHENDSVEHNINDMGFGYSQMLPILISIYLEIYKKKNPNKDIFNSTINNKKITFVIEQPELHLHPAYQSRLARVFANLLGEAKNTDLTLRFVFETHSKAMIDAIGECIEDTQFKFTHEDVAIYIFDKNEKNETEIKTSTFDSEGYLIDWPVGFFAG